MSSYTRVILVTGSNAGIGYDLVRQLAEKPNTVVYLAARNEKSGKEAQASLKKDFNLDVKFVQLEITDKKSIENAKSVIEKAEGKLDVLVNNAGNGFMNQPQTAITENVAEVIQKAMEVNFYGTIATTLAFLPLLRKAQKGYGVILNVSTDMASNAYQARPEAGLHVVAYNTSKAALNSYSIALAHELKKDGIKVNCFTPGFTTTKLNGYAPGGNTTEKAAGMMVPWCLLGPEDEKKTCLFYAESGEFPW